MVMSGTQTASTAGVSMPGVLAIFKSREGDYCFPGTPSPRAASETWWPFQCPAWLRQSQPWFSCATELGALPIQEAQQTLLLSAVGKRAPGARPEKRQYAHLP